MLHQVGVSFDIGTYLIVTYLIVTTFRRLAVTDYTRSYFFFCHWRSVATMRLRDASILHNQSVRRFTRECDRNQNVLA